ncbi:hypothetical protein INS49_011664 [Diaporthe citri]|uniref:uncharacterized protein n=1 Tax=Diaporthe citri TaxID=83186 RepID=UPI001C803449|nr:uncharacterized protein INS49_011664 [Diaporthe citri]KAG6360602.1 hypothetical protein INS49_011664 [Diaporthe citri]
MDVNSGDEGYDHHEKTFIGKMEARRDANKGVRDLREIRGRGGGGTELQGRDPGTTRPIDAPNIDAPNIDAPNTDAPNTDAPNIDAPNIDSPKRD